MSQPPDPQPDGLLLYPSLAVVRPTGWLLVNWVLFWPSAIYSLAAHWNKIDPAIRTGDLVGARFHAARVRIMGIIALWIGLFLLLVYIDHVLSRPVISNHG